MAPERTTILVGTDGSTPAEHAVCWAADEAARSGRTLRITHVVETAFFDLPGSTVDGVADALAVAGDHILREGRDLALRLHPELDVETTLVQDRSVPAGLRQYAEEAAEVVVGHRGRGGFAGLLLGSTSLRLAGRFPGSVVVVRGSEDFRTGEVVVGLDLVEDPEPALAHAFAAATMRDAQLRVLHAWRPAPLAVEAGADLKRSAETRGSHLATVLGPWRNRHPDVKLVEDVVIGHPVNALIMASAQADLVVVGSRGRAFPLGSVSHGAIHHAHCPVAVVRPRD